MCLSSLLRGAVCLAGPDNTDLKINWHPSTQLLLRETTSRNRLARQKIFFPYVTLRYTFLVKPKTHEFTFDLFYLIPTGLSSPPADKRGPPVFGSPFLPSLKAFIDVVCKVSSRSRGHGGTRGTAHRGAPALLRSSPQF